MKTDQEDCAYLDAPPAKPVEVAEAAPQSEDKPQESGEKPENSVRTAVVPDAPQIIIETNDEKLSLKPQEGSKKKPVNPVAERIVEVAEAMKENLSKETAEKEEKQKEAMKEKVDENMKQGEKTA